MPGIYQLKISDRERARTITAESIPDAIKKAMGKRLRPDSLEHCETPVDDFGKVAASYWYCMVDSEGPINPRGVRISVYRFGPWFL